MKKITLLLILVIAAYLSNAVNVKFQKHQITQPDGTVINCFVSGDEFFNWIHDENGYSIIQGEDGYYYYALKKDAKIVASEFKVNSVNPAEVGLQKWVKISKKEYFKKREAFIAPMKAEPSKAPHTGTLNNLVIYIRFNGDEDFGRTREGYDSLLNPEIGHTLKSYYKEVSYNQLIINSTHYPDCVKPDSSNASYEDSHTRGYFQPYNEASNPDGYETEDESTIREHQLLADAVTWVNENYPVDAGLVLDGDGDNRIDNVCFMIRGNSDGWSDLLWAHRWALYSNNVSINGKRVYDYTFQPENQVEVRTLCHEMFHALGAPDLYHYYEGTDLSPVGYWDLMEYGDGHMGAYMKYTYAEGDWISDIPEITTEGTYTLNPLSSSTNNCYKIPSPNSTEEFFIVEYRKKSGDFESEIPGEGLLVYRINSNFRGNASYDGNSEFDEVYIYRPGGATTVNGSINNANFSSDVGRTSINDLTDPSSFLTSGANGGLEISNITAVGETISFDVKYTPRTEITSSEEDYTNIHPIPLKIVFSEPIINFEISDIEVTNGEATDFTQVYDSVYTINVVPAKKGYVEVILADNKVEDLNGNGNIGDNWGINFNWPTGVNKLSDAGIRIYPNPSNGNFTIDLTNDYTNCSLRIVDLTGKVMRSETIANSNQYKLNLSELSEGIYILNLNVDNNIFNERIIIK